jgi:hypothetical protein
MIEKHGNVVSVGTIMILYYPMAVKQRFVRTTTAQENDSPKIKIMKR